MSDKRKGEEDKTQVANSQDEVKDDTTTAAVDDNKLPIGRQMQKGKKRKDASKVDADDIGEERSTQKRSKISVAPNVQVKKSTKKKTNAKMAKPRRMKITGM